MQKTYFVKIQALVPTLISKVQMDMNSLNTKRNSHGRVARDRGLRRAQERARRRGAWPGPASIGL
jgi:hypothetical protein